MEDSKPKEQIFYLEFVPRDQHTSTLALDAETHDTAASSTGLEGPPRGSYKEGTKGQIPTVTTTNDFIVETTKEFDKRASSRVYDRSGQVPVPVCGPPSPVHADSGSTRTEDSPRRDEGL